MLKKRSVEELKFRIMFANGCIHTLLNNPECKTDPRQASALERYTQQRDKLQAELNELEQPEPIVIGLKSGELVGKVPPIGE